MDKKFTTGGAMTIGEAAAAAGVSERTFRNYVYKEVIDPPQGLTRSAKYFQKHVSQAIAARKQIRGGQTMDNIALTRVGSSQASSEKIVQGKSRVVVKPASKVTRYPISQAVSIFLESHATRWEKEMVQEMRHLSIRILRDRA